MTTSICKAIEKRLADIGHTATVYRFNNYINFTCRITVFIKSKEVFATTIPLTAKLAYHTSGIDSDAVNDAADTVVDRFLLELL